MAFGGPRVKAAPIAVFALASGRSFGERVAQRIGIRLADHEEREFEWGQHKSRPTESVRGKDVYVVHSLHGDSEQSANDKLCRLLFFLGALRDADAGRVTAVVPFLCYSRKERRTKPRDPVMTRYVAVLFEAVGVDRIVTLEVHSLAAFQNAYRCRTEHLEAHRLFADFFAAHYGDRELVVVSPDVGGVKRADRFREILGRRLARELPGAFVEKRRSADVVSGDALVGDVAGSTVVLIDDMISGGTTLARASEICRKAGAREVLAAAAHGAFVPKASRLLAEAPIDRIAVLDHIPPSVLDPALVARKLVVLEGSALVAEAIRRMHEGGSLTELSD
jgi:ribose-phosphate pyrophosphokinase